MISFNTLNYFSGNFWQFGWCSEKRGREVSLFKLLHRASGPPFRGSHCWVWSKIEVRTTDVDQRVNYMPFKIRPYFQQIFQLEAFLGEKIIWFPYNARYMMESNSDFQPFSFHDTHKLITKILQHTKKCYSFC